MTLRVSTPEPRFVKELVDVADVFLPGARLAAGDEPGDLVVRITESADGYATAALSGKLRGSARVKAEPGEDSLAFRRLRKRSHKLALYHALKEATGIQPPWGSLTGVRPTRLVYERMEAGLSLVDSLAEVQEVFDISPGKVSLLSDVVHRQLTLPKPGDSEISVYIGIPFCVSRCSYCSFVSRVTRDEALLDAYTDALCAEIGGTAALIGEHGLRARAVYVGGGTPTAIGEKRLQRVLQAAGPIFSQADEVTVEAGRPDTLNPSILRVMRQEGANRLCVNPQTMNDATLTRIGRAHTAAQTENSFRMARDAGFTHINMDLIAGLPGEDIPMFRESLKRVFALNPESVTVHALSVKRSSDMHRDGSALPDGLVAQAMVELAREETQILGYSPYYVYRQKHMAGNQENVGYARLGNECLYNVDMMEDAVTVLAMGAGAISRRVWPGRKRILRAPNVKDITHYIARVGEMLSRKKDLMSIRNAPEPAGDSGAEDAE